LTQQPDNGFSDIGEAEQAARNKAVAQANTRDGALDVVISTRVRQLRDEPPPPDPLVARGALRDARTRQAWAEWHRAQAERHRATLTALVARHEAAAARLAGGG
jgi:hypothetical protein